MLNPACRTGRVSAGLALLTCTLIALSVPHVRADDATPPADQTAAPAVSADPFALPEASDPMSVQIFVRGIVRSFQTRGAEFRSQEGTMTYLNKMDQALSELQGRKLEEEPAILTANVRMQVLGVLTQIEDKTAAERIAALIKTLKGSDVPALKGLGSQFELSAQIDQMESMTPEQRTALVQQLAEGLKADPLPREAVGLAQQAADALQNIGQPAESVAAYNLFAKYLEARNEERLQGLIESLRGSARFAGLMGNPIEIKGTTVAGEAFDIAQYKGKVVLVDFWATWCGPCIGELPNVKQNYELYHSKGFEVVGISLDNDTDRLQEFLTEEKIEWVTLFPTEEDQRGWENPIARHYGISGIPSVILVNQDGNVVHLNARGPALGAELAKLLGPAEPTDAPVAPPPEKSAE